MTAELEVPDLNDWVRQVCSKAADLGIPVTALVDAFRRQLDENRRETALEAPIRKDVRSWLDRRDLPKSLRHLVGAFLSRYSSDRTRSAYMGDLDLFLDWLGSEYGHEDLARVDRPTAFAYAAYLTSEDYKPKTICRRLSSLHCLWTADDPDFPLLCRSPWHGLTPDVRQDIGVTDCLPPETVPRIVNAADELGADAGLIVRLLLRGGMRITEIETLTVQSIDDSATRPTLAIAGSWSRKLVLTPDSCKALSRWLRVRRDRAPVSDGLLVDDDGAAMDRHDASWLVNKASRIALGGAVHPDVLRRTGALLLWKGGINFDGGVVKPEDLRRHGGWSTIQTVNLYLRMAENLDDPIQQEVVDWFIDQSDEGACRLDEDASELLRQIGAE